MRRRSVLVSGLIGTLASAFAVGRTTLAQEATPEALADHPLVGTWVVMSTGGLVPQTHGADGSFIAAFPPNYVDQTLGLTFQGPALGRWEADGERTGHFTFIQALSDADGTYLGTFQLAAELEVSEDGQMWSGTLSAHIIMRDAANNVLVDQEIPFDSPVTATRVGATLDSVVLPVATPAAATPTA